MFYIIYNDKFYKVYRVRDNKENDLPDFLLCIDLRWTWVSCVDCLPETMDGDFVEDGFGTNYDSFKKMTTTAFELQGIKSMFINVRNTSRQETDNYIRWAEELGYNAKELDTHDVRVWK